MSHDFCGHNTISEAAICRSCNPKMLTEEEFRSCLGAMVDPRKVDPRLARILAELSDLVDRLEAREASRQKGESI